MRRITSNIHQIMDENSPEKEQLLYQFKLWNREIKILSYNLSVSIKNKKETYNESTPLWVV